jgi:hypothetical protein
MPSYTEYDNSLPYEVLGGIFDAWLAPVGTTFTTFDADPAAPWTLLGTGGSRNISEDGTTVSMPQSVTPWRSLRAMGPVKLFRQSEDLTIKFTIADMTLEQFAKAFEGNTVTPVAHVPSVSAGYRKVGLTRGPNVSQKALLLRFASPYCDLAAAQFEVPIASCVGNPELTLKKGGPMMLPFEFMALEDPDASSDDERFGRYLAVDSPVAS